MRRLPAALGRRATGDFERVQKRVAHEGVTTAGPGQHVPARGIDLAKVVDHAHAIIR
jgi:hypothetical protein